MRIDSAGWTHVGRRAHNEDAWVSRGDLGLFVVADGVARDSETTWPLRPLPKLSSEENLLLGCARLAPRTVRARRGGPAWNELHPGGARPESPRRGRGAHRRLGARLSHRNLVGVHDLGDFGIAKATLPKDQTRSGVRKGTYGYMSPEQARGGVLGATSDLFSLGILLHELLTGRRPFDGETPFETLENIREAKLGALADVDEDLRPVLHACLSRRPEDRVASAEALHRMLTPPRRARPDAGPLELARWVRTAMGEPRAGLPNQETVLEAP
ncbi:protein kinase [Myxococcus sp. AM011]|uniref:protein kinase domain-containing protein n=1 Tax=Myxococcus sp. AM011 TaxID=2745200 RepID=UPI00159551EB|nr:protein kinase [Myxococcus sp. AM011]NVJ21604.1 protein kinase [Myxococcus sp. AM011]